MAIHDVPDEYDPQRIISSGARQLLTQRSRGQRELTRAKSDLADYLGISVVTLNAKLRDDRTWDVTEVAKLARYFSRPVSYFYEGAESEHFPEPVKSNRLPRPDSNREPAGHNAGNIYAELQHGNLQAA